MTRIVGGQARGRRLQVPSRGTRPTSERAREALFNTLVGLVDIPDTRVLDLFAGSGAVGLEALSRGASAVTFVENDRLAVEVIRRNIAVVGLPGAAVVRSAASAYLVAAGADQPYGLVFADPPYSLPDDALTVLLRTLADPRWLASGGVVVVERSARGKPPTWPDTIEPVKDRRYGEGVLWYGRSR